MSSIEVRTDLSSDDLDAIVNGVVEAIRPLLETRPELVPCDTMSLILGVSPSTLERLRQDGQIPSCKIGSRRLYRPNAVIDALEATNKKRETGT